MFVDVLGVQQFLGVNDQTKKCNKPITWCLFQSYLAHGAPDSSDGAFPLPAPTDRIGFVEPGNDEGRKVHVSTTIFILVA